MKISKGSSYSCFGMQCSAAREKLQPLIIGKSKKPHCFRNIDLSFLGVVYKPSSKAWMTNPIYNEYLLDLNAYMASQNREDSFILR